MAKRRAAPRGGVDLGGTKIQTVVVDAEHTVLGQARRPTPTTGGPADVADRDRRRHARGRRGRGPEDQRRSRTSASARPERSTRVPARSRARATCPAGRAPTRSPRVLAEALGTPVALGNDVQVATDAEARLGAAREHRSMLGVFWGTGVGGGIVLDGKPWHGVGAAGEIGHVCIQMDDGLQCPCGRRGCMEAYAGRKALETRARELHAPVPTTELFKIAAKRGRERLTSGIWAAALERGDPLAHELMERGRRGARRGRRVGRQRARHRDRDPRRRPRRATRHGRTPTGSRRRWRRTSSTTTVRPRSSSPPSATLAARSARAC